MRKVLLFCLFIFLGVDMLFAMPGSEQGAAQSGKRVLQVSVFERAVPGMNVSNNWATDYINQKFGGQYNAAVEFIPIPRAQEVEKLNVLMAANDAPDIAFTYYSNTVSSYVQSGGLLALDQLLAEGNGKVIADYLGEGALSFGRWNNMQYALVARRIDLAAACTYIRKDWLDKLGLAIPTTRDEWYNALVAFKERDPGGLGSQTIPYALDGLERGIDWTASIILDSFMQPMTQGELASYPTWMRPGMKDALRFLNKLYNEGLISPNFALDRDSSQYQRDVVSGKVGSLNIDNNWPYGNNRLDELQKTIPDALYVPINTFENAEGGHPHRTHAPAGIYLMIPKSSTVPDLALDYLAWMSDSAVMFDLRNGVQGINYAELENGIPIGVMPVADVPDFNKFNGGDMMLICNGVDYGSAEKNEAAVLISDPKWGQLRIESSRIARTDGYYPPPIATPSEAEASLGATVRDKGNELYVRSIMARPEDFDATFDNYFQQYRDIGAQRIFDEKMAAWRAENPNR